MKPLKMAIWQRLRSLWQGIREWCGDSAYELYLRSESRHSNRSPLMSAEQFYIEQLDRRYSRPNRCC